MRTNVWIWTVVMLVVYGLQTFAQTNWATAVHGLDTRVIRLEMAFEDGRHGICSAGVLNAEAGYAITAQHCVDGKLVAMTARDRHAEVVRQNKILDLAVIRGDLTGLVNFLLAAKAPIVGSDIAILGYAWGSKRLHMQFGRVSLPLDDDGSLVIDAMAIGGDSGGPTINAAGELVGVTSSVKYNGPMHLAYMVPSDKVRAFVESYLPVTK